MAETTKHYDAQSLTSTAIGLDIPGFDFAHINSFWLFAFTGDHTEDLELLDADDNVVQTIPAGELVSFGGGGAPAVNKANVPTQIRSDADTTATFAIHRIG